jgi:hypothetical protein
MVRLIAYACCRALGLQFEMVDEGRPVLAVKADRAAAYAAERTITRKLKRLPVLVAT